MIPAYMGQLSNPNIPGINHKNNNRMTTSEKINMWCAIASLVCSVVSIILAIIVMNQSQTIRDFQQLLDKSDAIRENIVKSNGLISSQLTVLDTNLSIAQKNEKLNVKIWTLNRKADVNRLQATSRKIYNLLFGTQYNTARTDEIMMDMFAKAYQIFYLEMSNTVLMTNDELTREWLDIVSAFDTKMNADFPAPPGIDPDLRLHVTNIPDAYAPLFKMVWDTNEKVSAFAWEQQEKLKKTNLDDL